MTQAVAKTNKIYTLEDDLMPIIKGNVPLPNFEEESIQAVARLTYYYNGATSGRARTDTTFPQTAMYFLNTGQGGGYTGEGTVLFHGGWKDGKSVARMGRFSICKHEKIVGAGARPERGWHPGHCGKCGLDMSVDSGD